MELNFNSLTVDANGRVSFSGLSSGIDFRSVVDAMIAARRIPVDTLETKVADNQDKITALEDLRTNLDGLKEALSSLRGAVSFGNVNDVFAAKQAFASTSRLDGALASAASNLIGVTVTNAAAAGTHTIEVLQTAAAHKVSGDKVTSLSTALTALTAGDTFTINGGKSFQSALQVAATTQIGSSGTLNFTQISNSGALGSVTYSSTDTLQDLATSITTNVTGATATVVTSGTGVKLEITATDAMTIAETGAGTALTDLQILDKNRITVTGGETLLDLRDRINTAKTGVTASIASVSSTEHYLLLTKDVTGEAMVLTDDTGDALQSLGILTSVGAMKNELQTAQSAKFYVDGLLDQTNTIYESSFQTASTVQAGSAGTIQFTRDSDSFNLGSITYAATDTLQAIATNITTNITDVTASVVTDGAGVRLEITGTNGFSMAETGAGSALTDLGIDNKRLALVRNTNTVDDVFNGVTLSLFQAEKGTTIKVEIERDLSTVKSEIFNFVDAFNTLKSFVNEHRLYDSTSGGESEDSGALFNSNALKDVDSALSLIVGNGVGGVDLAYSVLAQIGINFINNNALSDPLLKNTLEIDETKLDEVLLNNADDVQRLFGFDFTPSDTRVSLLSFDRYTTYSTSGYTLNLHNAATGTNLAQYSEQADNAYWIALRSSVNADVAATTAPDGSTTADGLVADATLNSHGQVGVVNVTAGQTYVYSTYAKKGSIDGARLNFGGTNFDSNIYADFDLNAGTVLFSTGNMEAASIEDVGNGWYRISAQATARGTGSGSFERYTLDPTDPTYIATKSAAFTGDGVSDYTYLWGAQVETTAANVVHLDDTKLLMTAGSIGADTALVTAPNGTNTADAMIASTAVTTHFVSPIMPSNPTPVTSGQQYTLVGYARAGTRTESRLVMGGGGTEFPATAYVDFDLTAGGSISFQGGGVDSASIQDVGSGWYRIEMKATATDTKNGFFAQYVKDAALGINFAGTNDPANPDGYFWNLRVMPPATAATPSGYVATTTTADPTTANIDGNADGSSDGSATVANQIVTVNTGGGKGLKLLYSGFTLDASVQIDFTIGVGAQMFSKIEALLDTKTGSVETEIDTLTDTNEISESRIEEMLVRLEIQRKDLLDRFIRMEVALATTNRILDSIRQTTEALYANN